MERKATAMSLEALRKSLKTESDSLDTLRTAASAPEATDADFTALKAQTDKVKGISDRIDAIEAAEKAGAKAAAPVETSPAEVRRVYAEAANPIDKSAAFTMGAVLAGMAAVKHGHFGSVREALEKSGMVGVADRFEDLSRSKQLSSSQNTAGILVPPTMATEILDFLRPRTAFLQNDPTRVPMENGAYYQAAGNTGASSNYGAENAAATYSEATFRDINLNAKELKAKTAISNTLLSRGVAGIRGFVERDLRRSMSETMDRAMFLGNGQQQVPMGIYNISGIPKQTATNSATPNAAQVDADARWAINSLADGNVNLASARWTMSLQTAGFLEDMRDGNGNFLFPTMQGQDKTWKSLPVSVTTNLPTNINGNQSHISLAAYEHVMFGEEEGIVLRASTEASYTDAAGVIRSAAERNETVMFAFAKHDVGIGHLRAIALLEGVRWGRA
jgi:HK97 family phage major capsid protein